MTDEERGRLYDERQLERLMGSQFHEGGINRAAASSGGVQDENPEDQVR